MRKWWVIILFLLGRTDLWSENLFSNYLGRDATILSAVPTTDAGAILAGSIFVSGQDLDALLLKLNNSGRVQWKIRFGGEKEERLDSVVTLSDDTYVAVGLTSTFVSPQPFVTSDLLIVRFNAAGQIMWRKTIGANGDDRAVSVTATSDNGVVILASTNSFGDPDPFLDTFSDFLALKLNSSGEIQWSLNLAVLGDDYPVSSMALKDGSILLGGYGVGSKIIKISSNGKILWAKEYNEIVIIRGMSLLQDGSILVSGWGNGSSNNILMKINPSGTVVWSKSVITESQGVELAELSADSSGGAVVSALSSLKLSDMTLFFRISKQGVIQWKKAFDLGNSEFPMKLLQLPNDEILFTGTVYDSQGSLRSTILRFKTSGEIASCNSEIPSIRLKNTKVHSKNFVTKPERNLSFRITSPKMATAKPNLPLEKICP